MTGDIFGAGIGRGEKFKIVERRVIELVQNPFERQLENFEIQENMGSRIKFATADADFDREIMTVQSFAFAFVMAQGVRRREFVANL